MHEHSIWLELTFQLLSFSDHYIHKTLLISLHVCVITRKDPVQLITKELQSFRPVLYTQWELTSALLLSLKFCFWAISIDPCYCNLFFLQFCSCTGGTVKLLQLLEHSHLDRKATFGKFQGPNPVASSPMAKTPSRYLVSAALTDAPQKSLLVLKAEQCRALHGPSALDLLHRQPEPSDCTTAD